MAAIAGHPAGGYGPVSSSQSPFGGGARDPLAPSRTLPGSMYADPNFAKKQRDYEIAQEMQRRADDAANRERATFTSNQKQAQDAASMGHDFVGSGQMQVNLPGGNSYQYAYGGTSGGGGSRQAAAPRPMTGNPNDFWADYLRASQTQPKVPPREAPLGPESRIAAESAAFGRAKDRIGLATQGLMKSVRNNASRRGISGSALAGRDEIGALDMGNAQIGETIRDQAIQGLNRQYAIDDTNYAGGVQQRGQDISAENQRQQMILALARAAGEGRY